MKEVKQSKAGFTTATLTSKGQVTLPLEARKRLNLKPGMKLRFIIVNDARMEVVPLRQTVSSLKGMLPKPSVPLSIADMDQAIAEGARS